MGRTKKLNLLLYVSAILSVVMLMVLSLSISMAQEEAGAPVLPCAFYGNVTVNGEPVDVNTEIMGRIVGASGSPGEGNITVTETGKYGGPGTFDDKLLVETDSDYDEGKTIEFYVKLPSGVEEKANENATFFSGGVTKLDLTVTIGLPITGLTGEVNCSIEPDVTIILYNKTTGDKIAETTSDTNGNYALSAPCSGEYYVNASKAGFKNESQEISITGVAYTLNFRGEHGLTPENPLMSYALECVNHWLYPSGECGLSMAKALEVVNAWLY